jgi:hypothetical protein
MDMYHWVWLEIVVLDTVKPSDMAPAIKSIYVPADVVSHIPNYKRQLAEQLDCIEGEEEPAIRDKVARDPDIVAKAIRFLSSGYLSPLDAASSTCITNLHNLVMLYKLSRVLSIKRLETAVLIHIDSFEELTLAVFLSFARSYYSASGVDAQHTSLGDLIKKKLAAFMQPWVDTKTISEITEEGGVLGQQLIEVLLEDRRQRETLRMHNLKDAPIKIECD